MLKSHKNFHSQNGKRLVLIADDEMINREMLGNLLSADYELLYAEDGEEAFEKILRYHEYLSLVLLDIMMPKMNGLELLAQMKKNPSLGQIPVIVVTSDQKAEVDCLGLGASDFLSKPYPRPEVILARVVRTIELSEDRQIINATERDSLTGLYNKDYFYSYADQFDQYHKDYKMDAIVLDVYHFHMINDRFGNAFGDEILRQIGLRIRESVSIDGGIVCRKEADTFMVYCPHRDDYSDILEHAAVGLSGTGSVSGWLRMRMGVYADVDRSLDIERRFDRAKMAADSVRNNLRKNIGIYNEAMHETEMYSEQLLEDFATAIQEKQFKVYYQPKFDVRPIVPVLTSAEALVRWQHPKLGLVSPGVFIPLFENNGLIQLLDKYVWEETAAQIADWKKRFGISLPVSVNVSRVDMYDEGIIDLFESIVKRNGITESELHLEITESAYTQDSEQIIGVVSELRKRGFHIEMDDFGTGYSSLNMISELPIDALKLDMLFIRNAFKKGKDTRLLEVIIDIADYLSVPVIAEGVETEEQLNVLKTMGCDMVQGYYFSRPIPANEFDAFLKDRKKQIELEGQSYSGFSRYNPSKKEIVFGKITHALSAGFDYIYYIDTDNHHYVEFSAQSSKESPKIERSGLDFFEDMEKNAELLVYNPDVDRVTRALRKENLLNRLSSAKSFCMVYRLNKNAPEHFSLRAARANTNDDHHIVIGVNKIDEHSEAG